MGRGRKPEPTALKLLRGNPGKRAINKREPKPRKVRPRCPTWLDADAKAKWKQLIPELEAVGVLTIIDGDALANYCQVWARWKRAEEFIQKTGDCYPIKNPDGTLKYLQQVPQVSIARGLLQILRVYQQEFGLTPSARTRIEVRDAAKAEDEFEAFLNRKPA